MTEDSRVRAAGGPPGPDAFAQPVVLAETRARCVMTAYDYADQFTFATNAAAVATPQEWARAALEEAAGWKGQLVWRGVLGLRLAGRSAPGQVAGWRIVAQGDTWITLAARSWMLTGNLVLECDADSVSLATFVRYERLLGARVWKLVESGHRSFAPVLLPAGYRVLSARP